MRPGPTARAAAVLAVFLALFVAVDRLSGQRPAGPAVASGSSRPGAAGAPPTVPRSTAAPPTTAAPTTTSRPATTTAPSTSTTAAEPTGTTLRSPKGVTVQVLNGAFVPGLARRVADRVRQQGYQVVATNTALGNYTVSRIYYSGGHKADAEALRARFPAFEQVLPASQAQARLSREVDLHLVVGQNYQEI